MKEFKEAPWTLWVYAAASVTWAVIAGSDANKPGLLLPLTVVLAISWSLLLLLGVRPLWWMLVLFAVANIPIRIFTGRDLWPLPLELALLALLLAPASRYHVRPRPRPQFPRRDPAAALAGAIPADDGGAADPSVVAGRQVGWHIDPDDPRRMLYWSRNGEWLEKTTWTPKKLLQQRDAVAE